MIDMSPVLARFSDKKARIECDEGWHKLILDLDAELSEIDPNYVVLQIKEKFGGLRYYYITESSRGRLMDHVIRNYEKIALETCEVSGKPGVLMSDGFIYKTLCIEHAPERFAPVHRGRGPQDVNSFRTI